MIKFLKWWYRVKKLYREKKRDDNRVNKVCDSRDNMVYAEPLEVLWIVRRAFFGLAADCDFKGPKDDPVEYDKMLDIYGEINDIIKKHFGEEAAEE